MGFDDLAIHCRLPRQDLRRTGILGKPQRPDSQAILRIKSQRILPEPDLLSARVVSALARTTRVAIRPTPGKGVAIRESKRQFRLVRSFAPRDRVFPVAQSGSRARIDAGAAETMPLSAASGCPGFFRSQIVKQFKFVREYVVQITVNSQIAQVLLLFHWKAGIGLRLCENIEIIDGFLPDICSQERNRIQDRTGQLIRFDWIRTFE